MLCLSHVGISFCKLFAYYGVSLSLYYLERNRHVINSLRNKFGRHCAMVGYEFLDGESICESNIGISVADAADSTKSESDLVLTEHGLLSLSSAVQISLEICQMMKGCMVSRARPLTIPVP